jgi:hypothetical protein
MCGIVADGSIPPGPSSDGLVNAPRRRLDTAVLTALGMTAGEAAVMADRLYRSYARWRKSVESVEGQMQVHRRALTNRGGVRTGSQVPRVAATVWAEMEPVTALLFDGLTTGNFDLVDPRFRPSAGSPDQAALFDQHVVRQSDGTSLDLGDARRVELAEFLRSLRINGPIPIPREGPRCERMRLQIVSALAAVESEAKRRAAHHVSEDTIDQVAATVRLILITKSVTSMKAA